MIAPAPTAKEMCAAQILKQIAGTVAMNASPTQTQARTHTFSMGYSSFSFRDSCRLT